MMLNAKWVNELKEEPPVEAVEIYTADGETAVHFEASMLKRPSRT